MLKIIARIALIMLGIYFAIRLLSLVISSSGFIFVILLLVGAAWLIQKRLDK